MSSAYPPHSQSFNGDYSTNASSVDDLVSGAAREADDIDKIIRMAEAGIKPPKKEEAANAPSLTPASAIYSNTASTSATPTPAPEAIVKPEPTVKTEPEEKKSKKEKAIKMVYSDNEFSPEEKMAQMPRYAFVPSGKTETVLVDAATVPGVAGTVDTEM